MEKCHPVRDTKARKAWNREHDHCQICWKPEGLVLFPPMQTHHIIKNGRSDEPCNLLRVCPACHGIIEGERWPMKGGGYWPRITLGMILKIKHDEGQLDLDRLTMLYRGRQRTEHYDPLPALEELPEEYQKERQKWSHTH